MPWVSEGQGWAHLRRRRTGRLGSLRGGLEFEPEERVWRKGEGVGLRGDGGEGDVAQHLDWDHAGESGEIEGDGLGEAGEVGDAEDGFAVCRLRVVLAEIGEDLAVVGVEELLRAAAEDLEELAQGDHVARPVQERGLIADCWASTLMAW